MQTDANGISAVSLGAYAAWLAKRESKAPPRRRRPSDETCSSSSDDDDMSSATPYARWLGQKEIKLASSMRAQQDVESKPSQREPLDAVMRHGRVTTGLSSQTPGSPVANEAPRPDATTHQIMKRKRVSETKIPGSASPDDLASSEAVLTKGPKRYRHHAWPQASSYIGGYTRLKQPLLEEVRFWRDVDRFSHLS
ncbi:hypothetical protein P43SY_007767 [Pythium insidiosum]|uniref:Uncharacterized protein n=1 Tax=Pythium insidiosum TaxID=114742 RepID=A0AAD5Q3Q4_PYTIN|nr:hypothetical protein P43SY_007767 [Pythium insidiosum]